MLYSYLYVSQYTSTPTPQEQSIQGYHKHYLLFRNMGHRCRSIWHGDFTFRSLSTQMTAVEREKNGSSLDIDFRKEISRFQKLEEVCNVLILVAAQKYLPMNNGPLSHHNHGVRFHQNMLDKASSRSSVAGNVEKCQG